MPNKTQKLLCANASIGRRGCLILCLPAKVGKFTKRIATEASFGLALLFFFKFAIFWNCGTVERRAREFGNVNLSLLTLGHVIVPHTLRTGNLQII